MLGGGEHSFYELLCNLPHNWKVISTVPDNGELADKFRKKGIDTCVIPMPAIRPWLIAKIVVCLKNYLKICKKLCPQLIYTNSSRAAIYGGLLGKILGIPVIWHCRVADSDFFLDTILTKLCDRVIVNSNATARRFAHSALPKVKVIHNGINIQFFDKKLDQSNNFIDSSWKVILMVARASKWKRHDLAISCFEKIAHLDRKIHIIFVGNKDKHEKKWWKHLQEMTSNSRFSDRIHWIGHIEDVRTWYRAADLLLMPSENEPFGRVLVEAMASGVPVIAMKSGGVPEIVRHEKDGILIPMSRSHEMADAIWRILTDDDLRMKMISSGKKRAQEFDLESHVKMMIHAFEETLALKKCSLTQKTYRVLKYHKTN